MRLKSCFAILAAAAAACFTLAACDPAPSSVPASSEAPTTQGTDPATQPTEPSPTEPEPTEPEPTEPSGPDATDPTQPDQPTNPTDPTTPAPSQGDGAAVAELAKSLVGTPYRFGADGPDAFDNSGLIYYCMKQNGITVPRRTGDMSAAGTAVEKADLQPGDVLFFYSDMPGTVQYAGIYIGNQQFVASNGEDSPTCIQNLSYRYFEERYLSARRYS